MTFINTMLKDKVALITGGGTGVGKSCAKHLASLSARIAITELPGRTRLADEVVSEIIELGGEAVSFSLDLNSVLAIEQVVDRVVDHFGCIDILVNNAGTQLLKPALDIEEYEFDQVLDVNLKGTFFCSQATGRIMSQDNGGVIVNVASQHGIVGNNLRAPYCASKAGVINLSRALAIEWAQYNIRVNSVSPTFVNNGHNTEILQSEEIQNIIKLNTPLQRAATVSEVASGIAYLVSPSAGMVTGHNLVIDGGWTAR